MLKTRNQTNINHLKEEIQKLNIENSELSQKLRSSDAKFAQLRRENEEFKRQNESLNAEKNNKSAEMAKIEQKLELSTQNNAKMTEKVQKLTLNAEKSKSKNSIDSVRIETLIQNNSSLNSKIKKTEERISNFEERISKLTAENGNLKEKLKKTESKSEAEKDELIAKLSKKTTEFAEIAKKNKKLAEDFEETETIKTKFERENKTLKDKLDFSQNKLQKLEIDHETKKNKLNDINSQLKENTKTQMQKLTSLELTNENNKRQIELLKKAALNSSQHVDALKTEAAQRSDDIRRISQQLELKQKEVENRNSQLSAVEGEKDIQTHLTKSIRQAISLLNPYYDCDGLIKLGAAPEMSSEELYLRCVTVHDLYKCAFKEKMVLEDGLRRFSRYVEAKTPSIEHQEAKFAMLKKSYCSMAKRLDIAKKKLITKKALAKKMGEENSLLAAKKTGYKKAVEVMKLQVQSLLREKESKSDSEFVFENFKGLHEKYTKLLKNQNKLVQMEKNSRESSQEEKGRMVKDFEVSRARWKSQTEQLQKEIDVLNEKIISKAVSPTSVLSHSIPLNNFIPQIQKYQKLVENTNENLKKIKKESLEAISEAEKRARNSLRLETEAKSALIQVESERNLLKKYESLRREETENLQKESAVAKSQLESLQKDKSSLQVELERVNCQVGKERSVAETLSAENDSIKSSMKALEDSLKWTTEKLKSTKDLQAIQKSKIERLEETIKQLNDQEGQKVENLLAEKDQLEGRWIDLRNARELDLKSGREALEHSNNLAKKAMDELSAERDRYSKAIQSLENLSEKKEELQRFLTARDAKIKELEKFKAAAESAGLKILPGKNQNRLVFDITPQKIISYQRELEDLNSQKGNLQKLVENKTLQLTKTTEKLEKLERQLESEGKRFAEESERSSERLFKATHSLQKVLFENASMNQKMKENSSAVKSLEEKMESERAKWDGETKGLKERCEEIGQEVQKERRRCVDFECRYQNEVERHAETIQKFSNLQNETQKNSQKHSEYKTKLEETLKQLEIAKQQISKDKIHTDEEKTRLTSEIESLTEKCHVLSTELVSTNSLNRYLRNKYCNNEFDLTIDESAPEKPTETLQKQLENYKSLLDDQNKQTGRLENQLETSRLKLHQLEIERDSKAALAQNLQEELRRSTENLKNTLKSQEEINRLEKSADQVEILEENNKSLRLKLKTAHLNYTAKTREMSILQKEMAPKEEEVKRLSEEKRHLLSRAENAEGLVLDWERRCKRIFDEENYIDPEEHSRLKAKTDELKGVINGLKEQLAAAEDGRSQMERKLKKFEEEDYKTLLEEKIKMAVKLRETSGESEKLREEIGELQRKQGKTEAARRVLIGKLKAMALELQKYKLLVKKTDQMMKEEKELSAIYQRNAQAANARVVSIQKEIDQIAEKLAEREKLERERTEKEILEEKLNEINAEISKKRMIKTEENVPKKSKTEENVMKMKENVPKKSKTEEISEKTPFNDIRDDFAASLLDFSPLRTKQTTAEPIGHFEDVQPENVDEKSQVVPLLKTNANAKTFSLENFKAFSKAFGGESVDKPQEKEDLVATEEKDDLEEEKEELLSSEGEK